MKLSQVERELFKQNILTAGIDEVGRGCIAGPVTCGAVVIDREKWYRTSSAKKSLICDSKKIKTHEERLEAFEVVKSVSLGFGVASSSPREIETLGIVPATFKAMRAAIEDLNKEINLILVDGKFLIPNLNIRQKAVIKGDDKMVCIAAASIVAKITRDGFMQSQDDSYPAYGFANNVGYGTKEHLRGIERTGICDLHRRNFAPIKQLDSQSH